MAPPSRLRASNSDPRLAAPPPDDLGGELKWDWVPGYYTRIMLIQHIHTHMDGGGELAPLVRVWGGM